MAASTLLANQSAKTPPPADTNPVIPGAHPDPTVLRIGNTYWMTSTSGGWAPTFSLYRSTDLMADGASGTQAHFTHVSLRSHTSHTM